MSIWDKVEQKISVAVGQSFRLRKKAKMSGGSINQANRIEGVIEGNNKNKAASFFIKFNDRNRIEMFEAEAAGLQEIERSQAIHVPHVIGHGIEGNQSYLILEDLALAAGSSDSAIRLGQQLAKMHKSTSQKFGWSRENTIGSTKQINTATEHWIDFWREHRLGVQLKLVQKKGATQSLVTKGEKLMAGLEPLFTGYEPEASLLHGDLWSGNYGFMQDGEPVIFDPAVYYGDRETDIAMTELFGGFPGEFYNAYNEIWPLDKGYQQRKTLYNLYHILNHFNLFGGGYAMQAESMLDQLLVNIQAKDF